MCIYTNPTITTNNFFNFYLKLQKKIRNSLQFLLLPNDLRLLFNSLLVTARIRHRLYGTQFTTHYSSIGGLDIFVENSDDDICAIMSKYSGLIVFSFSKEYVGEIPSK